MTDDSGSEQSADTYSVEAQMVDGDATEDLIAAARGLTAIAWAAGTIIERTHANLITVTNGGVKLAELDVPTMNDGDTITLADIKISLI